MIFEDLTNPIAFTDTETTGVSPEVDRIIQIAVIKLYPDRDRTEWQSYVNPGVPIPPEASEIHGITDEMVKDSPTFVELGPKISRGFEGCDFGGYNVTFDLNIIRAEFKRHGIRDTINGRIVDGLKIFREFSPRDLTAAVREYLGEEFEGAHDALADTRASLRVIEAQLIKHGLPLNVEELHRRFFETPKGNQIDPDGKLVWKFNEPAINFGVHTGKRLRQVEPSYLRWIVSKDFSPLVKEIAKEALEGVFRRRPPREYT